MDVEFGAVLLFHKIIAQNVINVAMRVQKHPDLELVGPRRNLTIPFFRRRHNIPDPQ